jgi:hypothetical protein
MISKTARIETSFEIVENPATECELAEVLQG